MAKYLEPPDEEINWGHASYMLGKLSSAICKLVVGEGDVRSRLLEAQVDIASLTPSMLPAYCGIRERIVWVHRTITKYPVPAYNESLPLHLQEGPIGATLRRITNKTGAKIATRLLEAQLDLMALCGHHQEGHFLDRPAQAEPRDAPRREKKRRS